MHQQGWGSVEVNPGWVLQQGSVALFGKSFTKQKVTVSMHDENRRARSCALTQPLADGLIHIGLIVIPDPGLEQVTEYIKSVRPAGTSFQKVQE